jgi:quercetin dioxygenase-like cupin family protein
MRIAAVVLATALSAVALGSLAPAATAQSVGVSSKPLLRSTVSGDSVKESIILSIEFAPGATTGRHSHPGDEYGTVLQGTLELRIEGQEPRRVTAGEAYHNPQGVIHETRNVGDSVATTVTTFIVDKGKPRTVLAQ